ncbi:MAG TPA: GNAT family N-acetyltransferase [Myxococcales bacterium]|nr:GNAT family N-acetyltransferase [Myxococcales bacterium]
MHLKVLDSIASIPREAWDALLDEEATPFVRWDFLEALEATRCATARSGWVPRHLAMYRDGQLVAAAPAYARGGSDGDFSRDWGWASAASRAGLAFYPKLCLTVPFTPCTGRRILVARGEDRERSVRAIVGLAQDLCRKERLGSLQVLFPLAAEAEELERAGLVMRVDHQFHWRNEGYQTFDEFLARFRSKDRNAIKREMRAPAEQGIEIRTVRGDEVKRRGAELPREAYALHRSTIDKLMWGRGWLNQAFYERVFSRMPEHVEVVEARKDGDVIAGAFNVVSRDRLFGRYWGAFEEHPFLHFNVCLYHSVRDCIERGLLAFEGGAGGEHKLSRGFLPAETFSAHAFTDPRLDRAMREALQAETDERRSALARWLSESPILKPAAEAG